MKRFNLFTEENGHGFSVALFAGLVLFSFVHNKPPTYRPTGPVASGLSKGKLEDFEKERHVHSL
jgi:hypothetical protein